MSKFATNYLVLRKPNENGAISLVERLPADGQFPLRYKKTITGTRSYLIKNEERILEYCDSQRLNHVVGFLSASTSSKGYTPDSNQVLITKSSGVDIDSGGWTGTEVTLKNNNQQYPDIFYNPIMLLATLKGSLIALQQIHQHGIIHCDIKLDNICLPYDGNNAVQGKVITPRFDKVTLIDFGHSHWRGNPIGNQNRSWLGISEDESSYQSRHLKNVLRQWNHDNKDNKQPPYNNDCLGLFDYSCDLYGLGFAFKAISDRFVNNSQVRSDVGWSAVWEGYQALVVDLMGYDGGLQGESVMPHAGLIDRVSALLASAESVLGYSAGDVSLSVSVAWSGGAETPLVRATPVINDESVIFQPSVPKVGVPKVKSFYSKGLYGFKRDDKVFVIPQYDYVEEFSEGLALVRKDGKYGYINLRGEECIEQQYDIASSFSQGLAVVKKTWYSKCQFIDKHGEVVISLGRLYHAEPFHEGLSAIYKHSIVSYLSMLIDGEEGMPSGFINKQGEKVIPLEYERTSSFENGLAKVKYQGKCGFIDKNNNIRINIQYDDIVEALYQNNRLYGIRSFRGSISCSSHDYFLDQYDKDFHNNETKIFHSELAVVRFDEKYGCIDKHGVVIVPIEYDYIEPFQQNLAVVEKNDKYGFINPKGDVIISLEYDDAESFQENLARVKHKGKYGFINQLGSVEIPCQYDFATNFYNGVAIVSQNDKYGFINQKNEIIVPFIYDDLNGDISGLIKAEQDGQYGLLSYDGEVVIPVEYSDISNEGYNENLLAVKEFSRWGFINRNNERIIYPEYREVKPFKNGIAKVALPDSEKSLVFQINKKHERVRVFRDSAGSYMLLLLGSSKNQVGKKLFCEEKSNLAVSK